MKKRCGRCHKILASSKFRISRRDKSYQSYCILCDKAYHKEHNKRQRAGQIRRRKEKLLLKTAYILQYLKIHPCIDCGELDPLVLEFDHLNPSDKRANIALLITSGNGIAQLLAEITKCVVRCSNCHRRKTAQQFNTVKFRVLSGDLVVPQVVHEAIKNIVKEIK